MNPTYQLIRKELFLIDEELKQLEKQKSELYSRRDRLKNAIERWNLASQEIPVSDHAVVRYLERVHNIDIASIKELILKDNVKMEVLLGADRVRTDECTLVVAKSGVATVL